MGKYIKTHYSIESAKEDNYLSPSVLTIALENNIRKILFKNTNIKDDELILIGNDINNVKLVPFCERYLHFTALEDNAVISVAQVGSDTSSYDLQTSSDGIEWSQYTLGDEITLSEGETVYWRGNNSYLGKSSSVYKKFNLSDGKVRASGNIMSLLNVTDFETVTRILNSYCFTCLFYNCNSLTTAPELPATTLTNYCYNQMFQGCSNLTKAPELPATTLANYCYNQMFQGCMGLNYIKVGFTSWTSVGNPTTSWLNGVSSTGAFIKPSTLPEQRGDSYIPSGWTVDNAA